MLRKLPKYYGSFITQFGSITKDEANHMFKSLSLENQDNKNFNKLFSQFFQQSLILRKLMIMQCLLISWIGINNLNLNFKKQIPIFF